MKQIFALVLVCVMALPAIAQQQFREEVVPGISLVYETLDEQDGAVQVKGMEWAEETDVAIAIPEAVTHNGTQYKVVAIGENAFRNRDITEVVLPQTIRVIKRNAFTDCRYMRSIVLNEQLEEIMFEAFRGCMNLQQINFPSSLKRLERGIFQDCFAIKHIDLPALSYIPADMFRYCLNLESVSVPQTVKKIGTETFKECRNLKFVLPNNVEVGHKAFYNCASVKNEQGADLTTK
ncbi:MAG: leucine-rich repeat protein [Bacteroidia bacterium]|nr:leucine-rich repeat protein [Bacteroidia bacterium]